MFSLIFETNKEATMKAGRKHMSNKMRTTLVAAGVVATAYALPASGALPFSQTAGWFMGPPTSVVTLPTNAQRRSSRPVTFCSPPLPSASSGFGRPGIVG